ncbi:MAG: sugar isomerase [Phycisphaerae bacterium]
MSSHDPAGCEHGHLHCCCGAERGDPGGVSRRKFLAATGVAFSAAAMVGCNWSSLKGGQADGLSATAPPRKPLVVKPVFAYATYKPRPKTSWRPWGGIQTQEQADAEVQRITGELEKLKSDADFPVEFLPVSAVRNPNELKAVGDIDRADALIVYAAGGPQSTFKAAVDTGKDVIFFVRHRSGPLYLWYEIISPRYLRQHTDSLKVQGVDYTDVVVDKQDDIAWRLRALCGLKNTLGSRIVCIGGPAGWATPNAPDLARAKWKMDLVTVSYKDLGPIIKEARADEATMKRARDRTEAYLKDTGVSLETKKEYVEGCFLLDDIFRRLMAEAGAKAITVNACMGTIMRVADAVACLSLSTLNDDGYLAFCESDFVAIPAGILMANITGQPSFLNDPTYPHHGITTLAHCTAPRRMDGKTLEPTRIVTHFESDFGAAPKVEMHKGQVLTNVLPDFKEERWVGLKAEIVDAPFLPICRSQIDIAYEPDDDLVAERMPGFHWMTAYGDWRREIGYALKKIPIAWEDLG